MIYTVDGEGVDIGSGGSESAAKQALTGKVWIAIGDSYTVGMSSQLSTIASKYGMVIDNRGKVGATISMRSTDAARRLYNIVNAIISDYTNGYTIGGATYYASDVAVISFMAGANDGAGIDAWIGTGQHETANTTIYGSLNYIFDNLWKTFTASKIICVTQPANYATAVSSLSSDEDARNYGFDDLEEARGMDDYQYSNYLHANKEAAVRDIAWRYGLELVDMYHDFPSMMVPANRSTYWNSDELHLTTAGYNLVAKAIEKRIVSIYG
jgi:lysophospholipase L1-like esterase